MKYYAYPIMKFFYLAFLSFAYSASPLWATDSITFTCTSKVCAGNDLIAVVLADKVIDLSKILAIPPKFTIDWNFAFGQNNSIQCDYRVQPRQPTTFVYPEPGNMSPKKEQMIQKFCSFVAIQNDTGKLNFDQFFSNQSLTNLLAQYAKIPTSQDDQYLGFKKDDLINTIIVITDKDEQKVLYRVIVPKTGDMTQGMIDNFKASCKARGQTDDEIAKELPKFQEMLEKNTAFTAELASLNAKPRFGEVETYSYAH